MLVVEAVSVTAPLGRITANKGEHTGALEGRSTLGERHHVKGCYKSNKGM